VSSLALRFGKDVYCKHLQSIFLGYLSNTASSVRNMGITKSEKLAEQFGPDYIINEYVPVVINSFRAEKKGYNYRMCCLNSLAVIIPYITKEQVSQLVVPHFEKAAKDDIPNVKFCVSKIIYKYRQFIDSSVFASTLVPVLKEMTNDADKDVAHFATVALQSPM
jgi:serine/threonine-protein phosphatase 2A regulatory subunit A